MATKESRERAREIAQELVELVIRSVQAVKIPVDIEGPEELQFTEYEVIVRPRGSTFTGVEPKSRRPKKNMLKHWCVVESATLGILYAVSTSKLATRLWEDGNPKYRKRFEIRYSSKGFISKDVADAWTKNEPIKWEA